MYCIETEEISYRFSEEQQVLKKINLKVPGGSIYGFLGPNGAGKTTTLRLILGLLEQQEGTISIFGKPLNEHRISILQKTGSLIESPSFYGHLDARENLEILRKVYRFSYERIQAILDTVGLGKTGDKKTGKFSLGMKQRLGIAIALVHSPELLILDEPTNGLDPNGIIEMRELLRRLNRETGMTIVISSHLLAETEKLVDNVGIIHKGSLLFEGTLSALHQKQQQAAFTYFQTSENGVALSVLKEAGHPATIENGYVTMPTIDKNLLATYNRLLVQKNIDVYQIHTSRNDLESIFVEIVKD